MRILGIAGSAIGTDLAQLGAAVALVAVVVRLAREEGSSLRPDLPGVRLVVVGEGPEEARLRRDLPGAAFLGFKSGADLAAAYAILDDRARPHYEHRMAA